MYLSHFATHFASDVNKCLKVRNTLIKIDSYVPFIEHISFEFFSHDGKFLTEKLSTEKVLHIFFLTVTIVLGFDRVNMINIRDIFIKKLFITQIKMFYLKIKCNNSRYCYCFLKL